MSIKKNTHKQLARQLARWLQTHAGLGALGSQRGLESLAGAARHRLEHPERPA